MKYLPTEPNFGPSGPATVNIVGKTLQIIFDQGNEVVNLPTDVLPPEVDLKHLPLKRKYSVLIDGTRTKLNGFHPNDGSYTCEFLEFKKKPGQPPMHDFPRNRVGQGPNGPYAKDWQEFTAILRIVEEPFTGLLVSVKLRYYFGIDEETQQAVIKGEGKHSQFLGRFIEVACGDFEKVQIPFSDNILPALERLLQAAHRPFLIVMSKGFVDSFGEAPAIYLKAAAKKTAKKVAKKTTK